MSSVLVVAPHPDDETLGCGGTLLRHIAEGDQVHWLIMTKITKKIGFTKKIIESRTKEIEQVASSYGFESVKQASFITTRLDTYPKSDLIKKVSKTVNIVNPDTVYLPYRRDVHSDHAEVFDAVAACTKSFRYPSIKKVRAYETISETEFSISPDDIGFKPNMWVDISGYLDRKIEIMKMYSSEVEQHPFPRSEQNIRALATYRGAVAGVIAAEAFISLKEII